eukprot:Skav216527  [mRNA]  locus=scaffold1003:269389:270458:+ [translate_table: standard]
MWAIRLRCQAWMSAAGDERSHLTFAQFARWASERVKGRFRGGSSSKQLGASHNMCECGHKSSAHLSDVALMSLEEQEAWCSADGNRWHGSSGNNDMIRSIQMITHGSCWCHGKFLVFQFLQSEACGSRSSMVASQQTPHTCARQVLTKLQRRALGRSHTKFFAPERKPGFTMVTKKAHGGSVLGEEVDAK